jgi:probable phosphoglycerate mutase
MRTTFLLIRHGDNDWVGRAFAGRQAGVHLNERGREQAAQLMERLTTAGIAAIYSSPLERAVETIEPLAQRLGLPIEKRERLIEVGTGDWTGQVFADIDADAHWRRFNTFRSSTRPPNGELMTEIQARMSSEMEELRTRHPDQTVALVSHADVIRAAVALYSGVPIDLCHRLEIHPVSVSAIAIDDYDARILRLNDTGPLY